MGYWVFGFVVLCFLALCALAPWRKPRRNPPHPRYDTVRGTRQPYGSGKSHRRILDESEQNMALDTDSEAARLEKRRSGGGGSD